MLLRATWQLSAGLALACLLGHVALRGSARPWARSCAAFTFEFAMVAGIFASYQHTAGLMHTRVAGAVQNAELLVDLQRRLGLPGEDGVQRLFLTHATTMSAMVYYYAAVHLTSMTAFLIWMWWRHRESYPTARNTVALTTLACVVIQMVPVAPPRLMPGGPFVDVAAEQGLSMYGPNGLGSASQLAAMPSIHVAWAGIIAFFAVRASTSRWRWIIAAHLPLTVLVVTATANHWWLDGVAGLAVAALSYAAASGLAAVRRREIPRQERPERVTVDA